MPNPIRLVYKDWSGDPSRVFWVFLSGLFRSHFARFKDCVVLDVYESIWMFYRFVEETGCADSGDEPTVVWESVCDSFTEWLRQISANATNGRSNFAERTVSSLKFFLDVVYDEFVRSRCEGVV